VVQLPPITSPVEIGAAATVMGIGLGIMSEPFDC